MSKTQVRKRIKKTSPNPRNDAASTVCDLTDSTRFRKTKCAYRSLFFGAAQRQVRLAHRKCRFQSECWKIAPCRNNRVRCWRRRRATSTFCRRFFDVQKTQHKVLRTSRGRTPSAKNQCGRCRVSTLEACVTLARCRVEC